MADKLMFGVGFDLDSAVKEAAKDVKTTLEPLQKKIDKCPLSVSIRISTKELNNLDTIKEKLNKIKLEPISNSTKNSIKELTGYLKELAAALENIKRIDAKVLKSYSSADAARTLKMADQHRLAEEKLAKAKLQTELASLRKAKAEKEEADGSTRITRAYANQTSYLERLIKRLTVYYAYNKVVSFLTNIREVTAEFELQRISLGAIIQSQAKADELFSQIKSFALQSPLSILDLTTYTKQVAAYRIETEKLFDTTKRLADVSVGLGVDMSRIVLAYGQVKAASYLRAAEIRQFTEAGIPMLDLLAEKFSMIEGHIVTTEEVMDKVSKRAVGFSMVEDIFKDMTSAGGMFYNMQEKQGNTLYGMWAKLGDAASVMYNEIGNTGWVNSNMKSLIQSLTDLMRNWRAVWDTIKIGVPILTAFTMYKTWTSESKQVAAKEALRNAIINQQRAQIELNKATATGTAEDIAAAEAALNRAKANTQSARYGTTKTGMVLSGLKSLGATVGITAVITLVTVLIEKLAAAYEKSHRLKNALNEIDVKQSVEENDLVVKFNMLAKAALSATDGSKEQKDAIDELQRTYKDIIPVQDLTIEKLKSMHGEYTAITKAIREYVAAQTMRQKIETITSEYGADIVKKQKEIYNDDMNIRFRDAKSGQTINRDISLTQYQKAALIGQIEELAKNSALTYDQVFRQSLRNIGIQSFQWEDGTTAKISDIYYPSDSVRDFIKFTREQQDAIDAVTAATQVAYPELGKYGKALQDIEDTVNNATYRNGEEVLDVSESYLGAQMQTNAQIVNWIEFVKENVQGLDDSWYNMIAHVDAAKPQLISSFDLTPVIEAIGTQNPQLKKALEEIQRQYNKLVPSNAVTQTWRAKLNDIADAQNVSMDKVKRYLMGFNDNLKDYRKTIKETVDGLKDQIKTLITSMSFAIVGTEAYKTMNDEKTKAEEVLKVLQPLLDAMPNFDKQKKSNKGDQDNRLQFLQEQVSLVGKLYNEYKNLAKAQTDAEAVSNMSKLYSQSLKELNTRYGIELPQSVETYRDALIKLRDEMTAQMNTVKGANKKRSYQKAIIDLNYSIEKATMDEVQRKVEEQIATLSEKVSRTKTAKEFYNKILSSTGDVNLATRISFAFYGSTGDELASQIVDQIQQAFQSKDDTVIDLSKAIDFSTNEVDYVKLMDIYDKYRDHLIEKNRSTAEQLAKNGLKQSADQYQQWLKDIEDAKKFSDKRIELARYTATQIAEIEKQTGLSDQDKTNLIQAYKDRELKQTAKLEYDLISEEIGMFGDLGLKLTTTYEQILTQLKKYATTSEFKQLSTETQQKVYSQINALQDSLAQGFNGVGLGTVRDLIGDYSAAAAEYVKAQHEVIDATMAQIEAERKYKEAKKSGDTATLEAAQSELTLANNRVATANSTYTTASNNLVRTQVRATEASNKFNNSLQKIENSVKSLNNGGLKAIWDLFGDSGKASIVNFFSGASGAVSSFKKLNTALKKSNKTLDEFSSGIATKLKDAIANISPDDMGSLSKAAYDVFYDAFLNMTGDEDAAKKLADLFKDKYTTIITQVIEGTDENGNTVKTLITKFGSALQSTGELWSSIIGLILSLLDELGENGLAELLPTLLDEIGEAVQGLLSNLLSETIPSVIEGLGNVVAGLATGIANLITLNAFDIGGGKKARKMQKIIDEQEDNLEALQYAYERLQVAQENYFAGEWLDNFNEQKQNLKSQLVAYEKQLNAEKEKGKKADEDAIDDYEEKIRDIKDQIADLAGTVAEEMLGEDASSLWTNFAQEALNAYKEYSSVVTAIKEKWEETLQTMAVNSVLSQVMQRAMQPIYDMVDNMEDSDFYDIDFWQRLATEASKASNTAAAGANQVLGFLEEAGVTIRDTSSSLTGLSRDIAEASEESINGLAAGINTQNYYIAQINSNVAIIAQRYQSEGQVSDVNTVDLLAVQNQHLSYLPTIAANTADVVARCERAAIAAETISSQLARVIKPRGTQSTVVLNVAYS